MQIPENLSETLASLSDKEFLNICKEALSLLEDGCTPEGSKPFFDAIIAEQEKRVGRLQEESARMEEKLRFLEQEVAKKERERDRLIREKEFLEGNLTSLKRNENHKIGRNAPCPCGSGKKYKYCCGK